MIELQNLIGWAAVEKSKALESYLYQRDKLKNEIVAEGYIQRARAFDDIIKMARLLLKKTREQQP
jgi:hypothetical protein